MPAVVSRFDRWTGYLIKPARKRGERPLGNKLHEIAMRSPADIASLEVMADMILLRLNEKDRAQT